MALPDPLITAEDVANEPGVSLSASEIPDRWLDRAAKIVDDRLPNEHDDALLAELQTLTVAHFAYPSMSKGEVGATVESVQQGDSSISFARGDVDAEGPGGYASPFWKQAITLDDRLDRDGPFQSFTL